MGEKLTSLRVEAALDSSGYQAGAAQKVAADAKMVQSGNALSGAIAETERRLTSGAQGFERLRRSLDPAYDSQLKFAKGADTLKRALDTGKVSADEHAKLMAQLRARYLDFGAASEGVAQSSEHAHGGIATLVREFRGLSVEVSRGEFGRVPITLGLIAEHLFGLSGATLAWSAAILAIPAAFAAAAIASENSLKRIETQLRATANASGLTTSSADALAGRISQSSSLSIFGARSVVTELARGGQIPGDLVGRLGAIAPDFGYAGGKGAADAAKELKALFADPAKGARELSDEFALLSTADRTVIDDLVASGHAHEAQVVLLDAVTQRFQGLEQNGLGLFERTLNTVTKAAASAAERLGAIGRAPTPAEQLDAARERVAGLERGVPVESPTGRRAAPLAPGAGPRSLGQGLPESARPSVTPAELVAAYGQLYSLQTAENIERTTAAFRAQTVEQDKLIGQASGIAKGFDTVSGRTEKLANDAEALSRGLDAAQKQYDLLNASIAGGTNEDPQATERLKALGEILKAGREAQAGVSAAAGNQRSPFEREAAPIRAQIAAFGVAAPNRQFTLQRSQIEDQYLADLENERAAAFAGQLRGLRLQQLSAGRAAEFNDQFGASGLYGQAGFANDNLARIAAAGGSPAAIQAAQRQNEAAQATHDLALKATTPEEIAQVQQLTELLVQQYEVRDRINQQIRANDEDRQLQQTLAEKQLELALQGKNAEQRAQELADLRLRNQLVNEGYTGDVLEQEYQKRKQINEEIAKTDVALQRAQNADRAFSEAAKQFADTISRDFENFIEKGGKASDLFKSLERDVANLVFRLTVTQPLNDALTELITGKATSSGGTGGVGFGGPLAGLFSKGLSGIGNWFEGTFPELFAPSSGFTVPDAGFSAPFAMGGAFVGGRQVKRFAAGGIFDTPNLFQYSGGLGVLGEAGPEAIMPLTQLGGGKLGVSAAGTGGVNNHFYIDARGADIGVEQRLEQLSKRLGGLDASIERRAITAAAQANARSPRLFAS